MSTMIVACAQASTVATMPQFVDTLRSALAEHDDVAVDVTAVDRADISFLQVLEAARIQARADGRRLRLVGPRGAPLVAAIERSGLLWAGDAVDRQFWFPEGDAA